MTDGVGEGVGEEVGDGVGDGDEDGIGDGDGDGDGVNNGVGVGDGVGSRSSPLAPKQPDSSSDAITLIAAAIGAIVAPVRESDVGFSMDFSVAS